jgi:hypothetical protein
MGPVKPGILAIDSLGEEHGVSVISLGDESDSLNGLEI